MISCRISEIDRTLEYFAGIVRSNAPFHESRINATSRDLQSLRLLVAPKSGNSDTANPDTVNPDTANPDTVNLIALTEADVNMFKGQLTSLTDSENALLASRIGYSLKDTSRTVHLNSAPQAHKNTYHRALDSRLSNWLLSGSGTFWVSGNAGSGKSTFMNFIAKHPKTTELLTRWADSPDKMPFAMQFFWTPATPVQRSCHRLLQSLLYGLLRERPSLVALVTPSRWAAAKSGQWQISDGPWSVSELSAALGALATASPNVPLKMCIFIDGLDEYDGNHAELCGILNNMAQSPRIKICVSSRRWPVFEGSFGGNSEKNLDIHELTRSDIQKFVTGQLQDNPRWNAEVSEEVALEKADLIERIVSRADGVFVWALLVTRSLREGLSSGENIRDLNRRFGQLPSDLDGLFRHMLESVAPADHPKMANIFQVAAHALEPLHIDLYWQLERDSGIGNPDREHYHRLHTSTPPESIAESREKTIHSINKHTRGLLRVVHNRVEFLHRTVRDFVSTKGTREYLHSKLPRDYNAFLFIAAAHLGFLKAACEKAPRNTPGIIRQGRGLTTGPFIANLNQGLVYASEALKHPHQSYPRQFEQVEWLLDEYNMTVGTMVTLGSVTVAGVNASNCANDPRLLFREELLRHNLAPYLAQKIRNDPSFLAVFDESPLYAALTPMCRSSGESPPPIPEILDILLRHGEDPNAVPRQLTNAWGAPETDTPSPWVLFARSAMSVFNTQSGPCMFPSPRWNAALKHATFVRLLAHGADPNMPLLDRPGARTVFSHFLDISLSGFLDEECFVYYLTTLGSFLRAGAKLGVPREFVTDEAETDSDVWAVAVGNLARRQPGESVLATFCGELKGLSARLVADVKRAVFVSYVVEKLMLHCEGKREDLEMVVAAASQGIPRHVSAPMLASVAREMLGVRRDEGSTRRRVQDEEGDDGGDSGSRTKRPRRE